ncbi:hypothetical protein AAX26_01771 [Aliarcobacter thereius]|uniref:hypothetical protein n=1 Tax=Aliarcobacter thereius TaxID=544718 RepID=UPI000828A887|nr:hypothetical protein [Aliarcobacter thereius]OCL85704.1 hypothetical protein AAX26_01771 [Aliarcobacter thereius]
MSAAIDFGVLELIPEIAKKMQELETEIIALRQQIKPKYNLTKRSGVKSYLDISESTISKYIREGIFTEGYHYHRELKQKKSIIIFVSGAIEEFKKEKMK